MRWPRISNGTTRLSATIWSSSRHRPVAVSPSSTLELLAPAKVNVFLHVTGRRGDGYHTLETLMVPIDYSDRITLTVREGTGIVRTRGVDGVAAEDDLTVRAA